MTDVTLVYPYFQPIGDNSIFRFPPLGLGYLASYLKQHGFSVELVDCTFLRHEEAIKRVRRSKPRVIGIQAMFSMKDIAVELARELRKDCDVLVVGGPLATSNPREFLQDFDVAAIGEGEQTMLELMQAIEAETTLSNVNGIGFIDPANGKMAYTFPRAFIKDLDSVPFPSREQFDNEAYKSYYSSKFGYTTTSLMTSRGCPFQCDFCSRPIFGNDFRFRTATNVVDEIGTIEDLRYERVWFADDCFTLNRKRLMSICDELVRQHSDIGWECLSRVDTVDADMAMKMKHAGCLRVFFGIESGNDSILAIMKKQVTTRQAAKAVRTFKDTGIQVGAFFILGYPGETEKTILDTVRFASSLPLDYLSFTLPYPIPGTSLFERVKNHMISDEWTEPKTFKLVKHNLLFSSPFSETKLKFAIFKGMTQFYLRKYLGNQTYGMLGKPYEFLTEAVYRALH